MIPWFHESHRKQCYNSSLSISSSDCKVQKSLILPLWKTFPQIPVGYLVLHHPHTVCEENDGVFCNTMEINKGMANIKPLRNLTNPTKTEENTCWHCRNSTPSPVHKVSGACKSLLPCQWKRKWISSWNELHQKNCDELDLVRVKRMKGNWFI